MTGEAFAPDAAPVRVYDAGNEIEARLLIDWLGEQGIEARIASTAIEPLAGKVPFQIATCPVWVAARDEQQARAELPAFEARLAARGSEAAFCYHCGSAIAARQSPCPECGGELDWS